MKNMESLQRNGAREWFLQFTGKESNTSHVVWTWSLVSQFAFKKFIPRHKADVYRTNACLEVTERKEFDNDILTDNKGQEDETTAILHSRRVNLPICSSSLSMHTSPSTSVLCNVFRLYAILFNPLKPELNPSAQRCLTRLFTGDFASWTVHFANICVKNEEMRQLFIQFINHGWYLLHVSALHCHPQEPFLVPSERCSNEQSIEYDGRVVSSDVVYARWRGRE
jgi:hypothetical protein